MPGNAGLLDASLSVYDERGFMQIEPATCPACGAAYDPLRAQAVTVIDGRVRAFCSAGCRERGLAPPTPRRPVTDTHDAIPVPPSSFLGGLPTEQRVLIGAAVTAMAAFVALIAMGRHTRATPTEAGVVHRANPVQASKVVAPRSDGSTGDVWIQPLARVARPAVKRDRRLFLGREGLPANECGGVRCSVEIDAAAGAVVMNVHDGVVEEVERDPAAKEEGRFIRINHRGGAISSSYFQLDGIREDLRPGIPVKAGEPIGTVARAANPSTRPHIRFAMSVSDTADGSVLFIDPQPLLALWPVRHETPMSLRGMQRAPAPSETESESKRSRAVAGRADATE